MAQTGRGFGGDPASFDAFYRETVHDVERFIARRATDPHVVADLTADCFVTMLQHADEYRPDRGTARAWAFGIARHIVQEHHRRQGRQLRLVGRISGRALLDEQSEDDLVARIDAEREARAQLERIAQLPPAERELLELVAVDGLTLDEACAALRLRPGTARVRLHRARRRLSTLAPTQEVTSCRSS